MQITYSNKYKCSRVRLPGYEFEVLNEMKANFTHRTDSEVARHTRFLFEIDDIPGFKGDESVEYQAKVYVSTLKAICVRITYSGSKSFHFIVELPEEYETICAKYYKYIWQWFNETYFDKLCDTQCANPSRLTRTPNIRRESTGRIQRLVFQDEDNVFCDYHIRTALIPYLKRKIKAEQAKAAVMKAMSRPVVHNNSEHNGMCKTYNTVARYLNTPFPKTSGNGVSSKWLFCAVKTCQKYNDYDTLNEVLDKARQEHWTEQELSRIANNVQRT